jgi:tetratricopeptide (TPR) repeat protein
MHLKNLLVLVLLMTLVSGLTAHGVAQATELDRLEAAAEAAPRDYEASRAYGLGLLRAGRFRDAERQLGRAARLGPRGSLEPLFDVARASIASGDHRAAQRACRALGRIEKAAVLTYVCDARADLMWNRSGRAFEEIEAALALDGSHYEALYALGEAHRLRAAVAEAESAYNRAIAARPTSAEPHLGLGRLYAAAGRGADAIRELRRALELDPTWPDVQYELGRALSASANAEARRLLEQATAGRPTFAEAHVALGDARLATSPAEAEPAYRAAIALQDTLAPAHSGLGRALVARSDWAGAEPELRRAIELVANDAAATLALGDVLAHTDREEESFEVYRHATDLDPRNPEGLFRAARLALERNRDVLASGFLDRILESAPTNAAALSLYGDVMRVRSDRTRARDFYTRALAGTGPVDRAHVETALRELGP